MAVVTAPRLKKRRSWMTFSRREALWGYLLVLPACLLIIGLVAYPFFFAIYISFTDRIIGDTGEWVGLANFRRLIHWSSFTKAVQNTVMLVVVTDIIKLFIGLGLALILNERIRGRGFFRVIVLLPWAMPGFIAFLTWKLLFQPIGGGVNLVLYELGLHDTGIINWLGDNATAMPAVIIATVWRAFPFWCISFLAALQGVPEDLYEAAKVDGASAFRRFWDVTLPSIRPVIYVVVLLSSIWTANSFENVWIMTQGGPSDATMLFPVLAYFGMQSQRIGEAAAVSVSLIPALVLLVLVATKLMQEND